MNYEKTAPTLRSLEMPRLVVELPDGKEVHHHLAVGEVTIGRDPKNRITIADNFISKFHAKLIVSETSIVLVDLNSANKTYVNERPITESPVRFGDKICFAAVKCRLEAPGRKEPGQKAKNAPVVAAPPSAPSAPSASPPMPAPAPPVAKPAARAASKSGKPVKSAKPPRAKPPGTAPPPIEADPMKRLLRIGGLLILVSLALAILLRVLLVPSEAPAESETEASSGSKAAATPTETPPPSPPATASPVTTSASPTPPPAATGSEQNAEYYFDEGLAHLDTGRLREARASFHKALELDPQHARARTRLSLLEEEIEKKVELHFDNGRQAFQFLRYEEAIAEWEMFLLLAEEGDARYAEAQQGIQQAQAKLR